MLSLRPRIFHTIYQTIVKSWIPVWPVHDFPSAHRKIIRGGECCFCVPKDLLTCVTEGDRVVLRHKGQTIKLTSPLHVKGKAVTRVGEITHDAIIGKEPRDIVVSNKGNQLRVVSSLPSHSPEISLLSEALKTARTLFFE